MHLEGLSYPPQSTQTLKNLLKPHLIQILRMWSLIIAVILLCALTLFILLTWNKYSIRDIVVLVLTVFSLIFVVTGLGLYKSQQVKYEERTTKLYDFYKNEIEINRQEVVQETMEAYYENRIQETATVVDGITRQVKYAIKPVLDKYPPQK